MRRRAHSIACLLAGVTMALPAAAHGQSAGDEQYEDPFAPGTGQADGGGSSGGGSQGGDVPDSSGGGSTEPAPAPTPVASEPSAQTVPAQSAQEQLPRTGADAGLLALTGTLLLAGGVALRVRLSAPAPRRRGRGGHA